MKIHQQGAKKFNKTHSLEVSIAVVTPHFDCLIKGIPVIEVSSKSLNKEPRNLTKHASLEVSIELLSLILIIPSKKFLSKRTHENLSTGAEIFNKRCSSVVSIGFLPLF